MLQILPEYSSNSVVLQLGASICMEQGLYKEVIKWCDEGLAVSFDILMK